jgi:hypothetical protein
MPLGLYTRPGEVTRAESSLHLVRCNFAPFPSVSYHGERARTE